MIPSWRPLVLLAMAALPLALGSCGRGADESEWMLHVAQIRMPIGHSRLLSYDYPHLILQSETNLGSISVRAEASPDHREVWVGSEGSRDIFVLDATGARMLDRINLGATVGALAFSPSGRWAAVAHGAVISHNGMQANASLISRRTREPVRAYRVGHAPRAACFAPDGQRLFVGNTGDSTVTIIDIEAEHTVDSLVVGFGPAHISADPRGRWLYVSCLGMPGEEGRARGAVHVLALPSLETLSVFAAGQHPSRVTPLPGGDRILVSELRVRDERCSVRIFEVTQDSGAAPQFTLKTAIGAGGNPLAGSLSPDGKVFAVPDFDACRVALIDTEGERLLRWLQLPGAVGEHFAVDAVWTQLAAPAAADSL